MFAKRLFDFLGFLKVILFFSLSLKYSSLGLLALLAHAGKFKLQILFGELLCLKGIDLRSNYVRFMAGYLQCTRYKRAQAEVQ